MSVLLRAQQGIGIDILALPVALGIGNNGNRKVKVIISGAGIASVAHKRNDLALSRNSSYFDPVGAALKVSIVKHQLFVRAQLIDCGPAAFALEKFDYFPIGSGENRRSCRRRDIDGIVNASFGSRIGERIQQLVSLHSGYGDDEFQCTDEIV